MSIYVLDMDIASLHFHGNVEISRRISGIPLSDLATTIVNVEEMLSGWYTRLRKAKNDQQRMQAYIALEQAVRFAASLKTLQYDLQAIQNFENFRARKLRIGSNDMKIAAIVLATADGVLVTRNRRDFDQVSGLMIEEW
jgi:tRNA(fMet)-specific endonuclease VapC